MNKNDIPQFIVNAVESKEFVPVSIFDHALVHACKSQLAQPINLEELELKTVHLLEAIRMAKSANSSYSEQELINNVKHFLNQL